MELEFVPRLDDYRLSKVCYVVALSNYANFCRKLASSDFTIIDQMTNSDVFEAPGLVYPSQSRFIVVPDLSREKYEGVGLID